MDLAATFNRLPPNTKRTLAVGGALLAGFVLLRGRNRDEAPADEPAATDATALAGLPYTYNNDALGVDDIMEFKSDLVEDYLGLANRLDDLENRPQAPTPTLPKPVPHTVRNTYVLTVGRRGETPNEIAIRLRNAGQKAANGSPLTADYLRRMNGWKTAKTAGRWPGENVRY